MPYSAFDSAIDTLVALIGASDWDTAQTQLMVCSALLSKIPDSTKDGDSFKFRAAELDRLQKLLEKRQARRRSPRVAHTRTNYAQR